MPRKEGKGRDLDKALADAIKDLPKPDLGWYTIEKIEVEVGNPQISQYKVTISK